MNGVDYFYQHSYEPPKRCEAHSKVDCYTCKPPLDYKAAAPKDNPPPTDEQLAEMLAKAEAMKPRPAVSEPLPFIPATFCQHRQIAVNGTAMCHECLKDRTDNFAELLTAIIDVSRRVARSWKFKHYRVSVEDRQAYAFISMWQSMGKIIDAKNPLAMAWTIGERGIRDIGELRMFDEQPISELLHENDGDAETDDDAFGRITYNPKYGRRDTPLSFGQGDKRMLVVLLTEAFTKIPPHQSLIIRLRYGFFKESGALTQEAIAEIQGMTRKRVRWAIDQGLQNLLKAMLQLMREPSANI